jgi:hypothetical protein
MKKVLFTALLVLVFATSGFAGNGNGNGNDHDCPGNSCNSGGGSNVEVGIGIISAPIFAPTYTPIFKPEVNAEGGTGIGIGFGGEGGKGGDAHASSSSNSKSSSEANSASMGFFYNGFEFNQNFERPVMETVQSNNSAVPLVKGDVWNYETKMGKPFEGVSTMGKVAYKEVIIHKYTLDFWSPLAFRMIRSYDIERLLVKMTSDKESFSYKVLCYDGQSGWGAPAFLGGGGTESGGLSTVTGSIMPTYNRSDADPACIILEYVK